MLFTVFPALLTREIALIQGLFKVRFYLSVLITFIHYSATITFIHYSAAITFIAKATSGTNANLFKLLMFNLFKLFKLVDLEITSSYAGNISTPTEISPTRTSVFIINNFGSSETSNGAKERSPKKKGTPDPSQVFWEANILMCDS